jgi:hypothetical protein
MENRSTAGYIIAQHSLNDIYDTAYRTYSDKSWTRDYPPIKNLIVHSNATHLGEWQLCLLIRYFSLFFSDDARRLNAPAPIHREMSISLASLFDL